MVVPHTYPAGCSFPDLTSIAGKKITVMGLGLNGGGEASVRFFLKHGARVTVTDMKTAEQLAPTLESLKDEIDCYGENLRFVLGKHDIADFESADVVIKNPGVKYDGNIYLAAAKAIETDISVFLQLTRAPVIAVTGSKGKSSTVSAIYYGLCAAGFTAFLGGNITVSPLSFLDKTHEHTPVVLELSSWQLADLRGRNVLKPHIAVITTIVPDHQNWYGSMEAYVADKKLIYASQTTDDWTICAAADPWGNIFATESPAGILRYGRSVKVPHWQGVWLDDDDRGYMKLPGCEPIQVLDTMVVPGNHMKVNALNAALVMGLEGIAPDTIKHILATWPGIAHRLEYFHSWQPIQTIPDQIKFYNDSAATVPEAAAAAAGAFEHPVHLICGGTDKNLNFEPLVAALSCRHPASLWLLAGTGTDKLVPMLEQAQIPFFGPFNALEELLLQLKEFLSRQDYTYTGNTDVIFSPGATSFGMFKNEFHRGNCFKSAVQNLFV